MRVTERLRVGVTVPKRGCSQGASDGDAQHEPRRYGEKWLSREYHKREDAHRIARRILVDDTEGGCCEHEREAKRQDEAFIVAAHPEVSASGHDEAERDGQ